MVKLLLMKGVALFYAKKYPQAKDCLSQALQLLTELQVNPDTLQEMLLMGFSESEARLDVLFLYYILSLQYSISKHEKP